MMTRNISATSPGTLWRSACVMSAALCLVVFGVMYQGAMSASGNAKDESMRVLRHVVMFKFKDGTADADIQKVVDAFRALKVKIPEISAFEYGTDNSPEGLANGFTHCFLITFKDEAGRAAYLPHPAHKAFVDVLKPHLDKVQVIDYFAHE
jgi:hypothetical protein